MNFPSLFSICSNELANTGNFDLLPGPYREEAISKLNCKGLYKLSQLNGKVLGEEPQNLYIKSFRSQVVKTFAGKDLTAENIELIVKKIIEKHAGSVKFVNNEIRNVKILEFLDKATDAIYAVSTPLWVMTEGMCWFWRARTHAEYVENQTLYNFNTIVSAISAGSWVLKGLVSSLLRGRYSENGKQFLVNKIKIEILKRTNFERFPINESDLEQDQEILDFVGLNQIE